MSVKEKTLRGGNRSRAVSKDKNSIARDMDRAAWVFLAAWACICVMEVMGWTL